MNVTEDHGDNVYASSDLIVKTTIAYIIVGAMKIFGIKNVNENPKENMY